MYQELFQFPPGREGYYGPFGGAFIPEMLHETIDERAAFAAAHADPIFWDEYELDGKLFLPSDATHPSG